MDKNTLAERVEPLDAYLAGIVRSDSTVVEPLPTPFLERGAVYQVTARMPSRPIVFTVGVSDADFSVLLAANPKGYLELARRSGARLDTDELRRAYVTTFLESTRSFADWFEIVGSAGDIEPRPNLDDAQSERMGRIREKYRTVIAPPSASPDAPRQYVVFAVRQQDLVRIELGLDADEDICATETILERNVPTFYHW